MLRYTLVLFFAALAAAPATATHPLVLGQAQPDLPSPQIIFPDAPSTPTPDPGGVTKLNAGEWYVVQANVPTLLLMSPAGLVSVVEEQGPIRLRGTFQGGNGKVETRNYTAKQIFLVEAVSTGRVEIIAVPLGLKKEAEIIRRVLDVATAPRPPPIPPPVPPPVPPPAPSDPLWPALLLDYRMAPNPEAARTLASFYRVAADLNGAPGSISDQKYQTVEAFHAPFFLLTTAKVPKNQIPLVRDEFARSWQSKFGTNLAVPLTADLRQRIAAHFVWAAGLLEELAK